MIFKLINSHFYRSQDFAEAENQPGLLVYIAQQLRACDVYSNIWAVKTWQAMILLDGLMKSEKKTTAAF